MFTLLLLFSLFSSSSSSSSSMVFRCSVSKCAYFGARATCCPTTPCLPIACAVWHATQKSTLCDFSCSSHCLPPSLRPIATDAIAYCNHCTLHRASCKSGFDILGPIDRGVEYAVDVEVLPTPVTYDLPELTSEPSPEQTSAFEMEISPSPELEQLFACSIEFCSRYGAHAECESSNGSSTCATWSAEGDNSDCFIFCTYRCIIGPAAPIASDGRKYCSLCHLQLISCRSAYTIYGPINANAGPTPIPDMIDSA